MEKQEAVEAFENATEANRTAVLLTQWGKYTFIVDFSIEPESRIVVKLTYFLRLARVKGHYDLNVDLESIATQNPLTFSAEYSIFSPLRSIENVIAPIGSEYRFHSSNHVSVKIDESVLSTGFLRFGYDLSGEALGSNIMAYNNGTREFFLATFSPSLSEVGVNRLPKDFVFLIDVSGSMSGTKITQARTALLEIIDQLSPEDRLGIVEFSTTATPANPELINRSDETSITTMKRWVEFLVSGGSTNIHEALITGLDLFDTSSSRSAILVLLTDGQATTGLTNPEEIENEFQIANLELQVSLFTLGFGNDVNWAFLQRIARQNNGEAIKIEEGDDASSQITTFYDTVSTPVLTDIKLILNSGVVNNSIFPYFMPTVYEGSEIFLVGEREPGTSIDITIIGNTASGEVYYLLRLTTSSSTNSEDSWIEKAWAIAKIDELITRIFYGDVETNVEEVLSLALYYGIVTPFTAMFIDTTTPQEPIGYEEDGALVYGATYTPATQPAAPPPEGIEGQFLQAAVGGSRSNATPGFIIFMPILAIISLVIIRKNQKK